MCHGALGALPGATPLFFDANYPPTNCRPEAPWGGGLWEGAGLGGGGFREGRRGGRFPGGGGTSHTAPAAGGVPTA